LPAAEKIYYLDRLTGEKKEERILSEKALRFMFLSRWGKSLGKLIAYFPFFSHFIGWWQKQGWTQRKIQPFIKVYGIDASECAHPVASYPSFDAFFTRTLKKGCRPLAAGPILPADGRYLVYQDIAGCEGIIVKGKKFSLERLVGSASLASAYLQGSMVIVRLAPSDYHRFHFPVDCIPEEARLINGPLFSVNPLVVKQNINLLAENKRMITPLKTDHYGTILFIEIGATTVGSIHQTYQPGKPHYKGDEKGYFSFGGSSLILLFEKRVIHFADDLTAHSVQHIETLCRMGQNLTPA
jgi:phosphatidylserine decarboxylase